MTDKTKPKGATSYKETAFGIIPRSELIKKEAEGIARGLEYILSLSPSASLTPSLILELHHTCFNLISPAWAGKYRKIAVQTSTHDFPPFHQVPELTERFFADLNERLKHTPDPISLIAWAQHRLVWIHPFQDYNGRIARLFSNLLMLRFNLPLVEIKVESENDRKKYISALKAADEADYSQLEYLIASTIKESS